MEGLSPEVKQYLINAINRHKMDFIPFTHTIDEDFSAASPCNNQLDKAKAFAALDSFGLHLCD